MTCFSGSPHSRTLRVLALLPAVALVVSGCGLGQRLGVGSSPRETVTDVVTREPIPARSGSRPGPRVNIRQARAALPKLATLTKIPAENVRYKVQSDKLLKAQTYALPGCPGRGALGLPMTGEARVAYNVLTPRARTGTFRELTTYIQVFPNRATAARYMAVYRSILRKCKGQVRHEAARGMRGRNHVTPFSVRQWSGMRTRTLASQNTKGGQGPDRYWYQQVITVLIRGNVIINQSHWQTPAHYRKPAQRWLNQSRTGADKLLRQTVGRL